MAQGGTTADVVVSADVTGTSIALVTLEVTAPDLATPLVFNLTVIAGVAARVVALPVGPARTLTGRAFDAAGGLTHEGKVTIDVIPGVNPPVTVPLVPLPGDVPIVLEIGPVTVTVSPASLSLRAGDTARLVATVRSVGGDVLPLSVTWSSTDETVATVTADGLVAALAAGDVLIAATCAGTAALVPVHVSTPVPAATPTFSPAPGVYSSARSVTIASATPGAVLRYTLDGTLPTAQSAVYGGPLPIPATRIVKAIAQAPGFADSAVATGIYVIESGGTTLNGHTLVLDGQGLLLSWLPQPNAFAAVVDRTCNALLRQLPTDGGTGLSLFMLYPYLTPGTYAIPYWPNAPGSSLAMLVDAALLSYPFTGDPAVLAFAKRMADHYLVSGLTAPTDRWASVPYAEGDPGSPTYGGADDVPFGGGGVGDGRGVLEPDKVAELGHAFLRLHEWDGTTAYRDAAIRCADALVANRQAATSQSVSPWPFRVYAATGVVREPYTAHVLAAIQLFDELLRLGLGDTAGYRTARDAAWTWLLSFPMSNGKWAQYFEDIPVQQTYDANLNQLIPGNTARHLLSNPGLDASWEAHARGIIAWVEAQFGKPQVAGAMPVGEQSSYNLAMGSHTSRYGAVNALLFERTGDAAAKEKAYRALNWASYMNRADGATVDGNPLPNQIWMTDGFGDYVRHFAIAMAAVPEWSPPGEDHLLRSTSVVQAVTYARGRVSYRTFDPGAEEVLRLTFTPTVVTAGGQPLSQRGDLAAPGWTWDAAGRVLRVRHDAAGSVEIR